MVNIDVIDGPFNGYYTMIMVIINISKQLYGYDYH